MPERFFALTSAAFLVGCGGVADPYAPAPNQAPPVAAGQAREAPSGSTTTSARGRAEGRLEISAGKSFLGAIHAVVTDAAGQVIGGADEEQASPELAHDRSLAFLLPAAEGLRVSVSATTADSQPTTCRASIGALRVEAGATARVQVFSWDCGGVAGYVPALEQPDCYWLADWSFVTRTRAAVGALIGVSAAARDLQGNPTQLSWSTTRPDRGTFAEPESATTSFRCTAPGELDITALASDGDCAQAVTQTISCL